MWRTRTSKYVVNKELSISSLDIREYRDHFLVQTEEKDPIPVQTCSLKPVSGKAEPHDSGGTWTRWVP